eukprot:scaffold318785_cov79-Cyclotella_meneghiniana.AAC.1
MQEGKSLTFDGTSCLKLSCSLHMCHKPTMTVFLRNFRVSSENRPQTVISANLALFSPYFARTNPDSPEEDPDDPLVSQNNKAMTVFRSE